MTLEEASSIGNIVNEADGGCSVCVEELVQALNKTFSDFVWSYDEDMYEVNVGTAE